MNAKFFRQRYDVLATLQSLDRHSTELVRIPSLSSPPHLQFLSLQSVPFPSVSSEGFSPEAESCLLSHHCAKQRVTIDAFESILVRDALG